MTLRVLHAVASVGDSYGGVAAAVAALGGVEARLRHDATLVTVHRPEEGGRILRDLPLWFDVELVPPGRLAGRFHGSARLKSTLARLVPQHDLVVVHGVFDFTAHLCGRTARQYAVPYLVWPHGSLDPYDLHKHAWAKRRLAPLWRETLAGAAAVVCTTAREAERLVDFGAGSRRTVLPLPVPTAAPDPRAVARRACGLPEDGRIVLFLGRIDEKKGLPLLLAAFDRAARPGDVLVVAGAGDDRLDRELRTTAAARPGAGRVVFTGWADPVRRRDLLAAADVFALLSDNENFGVAVAEALVAGVAVLVSDEVYLGDELAPEGAAVVTPRDPAAAGRALRDLLGDDRRRRAVGAAGRAWACRELDDGRVGDRYRQLVKEVLTRWSA
ncbi:glycosyltransferase [Amycolatopsis sp., V23-08]|uniref:Glycosyltransferase n=1 Tax=Amycolatopsis heterodermiae TaxID=3110235 RepID=A0ABU5R9I5_9PSEU|nr:glycosyltransferase [Amycolatopsis sp., V23-08]MEA5362334.1 glycosyltransferase [Amycolatopsis sp., V23-08]